MCQGYESPCCAVSLALVAVYCKIFNSRLLGVFFLEIRSRMIRTFLVGIFGMQWNILIIIIIIIIMHSL